MLRKLVIVAAAFLLTCKLAPPAPRPFVATLPSEVRKALQNPIAVHFHQIAYGFGMPKEEYEQLRRTKPIIVNFPVLASATGDEQTAKELSALLLDQNSYMKPGEEWACIFEPGYIVQIVSAEQTAYLTVCFKCGEVALDAGNEQTPIQGLSSQGVRRLGKIIQAALPQPRDVEAQRRPTTATTTP